MGGSNVGRICVAVSLWIADGVVQIELACICCVLVELVIPFDCEIILQVSEVEPSWEVLVMESPLTYSSNISETTEVEPLAILVCLTGF